MESVPHAVRSLSSAEEIIAAVTAIYPPVRHRRRRRSTGTVSGLRTARDRSRRCRCGNCGVCIDEARWERIFNEKFAYPEYYVARRQENWSTLARK